MGNRRPVFDLFLVSALGLFIELVFIRWVASELRVVAFYKNFALIAAFLGLGLGFAYRRRAQQQRLFERYYFPLLAASSVVVMILGRTMLSEFIMLNRSGTQEYVWAGTIDFNHPLLSTFLDVAFYSVVFFLFVMITLLFIPLGELTARKFAVFQPLRGYTVNVFGSLSGILVYTLVSFLGWPPESWFLMAALAGLYFLRDVDWRSRSIQAVLALMPALLALFWPTGAERTLWSPYYRIDIRRETAPRQPDLLLGYELSVNQAWHQRMWNLSQDFVAANYDRAPEHFDAYLTEYNAPFQAASSLEEVLIVGSGAGNDVAAAKRSGAGHVTAVDIDPTILRIGQEMHPEGPYADAQRVTQVAQDARSFFRRSSQTFDLIVFARLDSHTLFSTASSVRLDNFVYTQESLSEVRNLLQNDGLLALSFGVPPGNEWLGLRLYRNLSDVFGHAPQVYEFPSHDILFLIGKQPFNQALLPVSKLLVARPDYTYQKSLETVTDDWPYLYLKNRNIPSTYLIGLCGVLLISLLLIRRAMPDFRQINLHFFFMGAAFFLLETRSITEMALLFGSTWLVNAVVIAAILTMIVMANLIVGRFNLRNPYPFYALLALSLMVNFLAPVSSYLGLPLGWRILFASLMQAAPLFFAGMIFAITFNQAQSIESALGSNLFGSVLGGLAEYLSLALGLRYLYLLALVFYLLAAWAIKQNRMEVALANANG